MFNEVLCGEKALGLIFNGVQNRIGAERNGLFCFLRIGAFYQFGFALIYSQVTAVPGRSVDLMYCGRRVS